MNFCRNLSGWVVGFNWMEISGCCMTVLTVLTAFIGSEIWDLKKNLQFGSYFTNLKLMWMWTTEQDQLYEALLCMNGHFYFVEYVCAEWFFVIIVSIIFPTMPWWYEKLMIAPTSVFVALCFPWCIETWKTWFRIQIYLCICFVDLYSSYQGNVDFLPIFVFVH